MKYSGRDEVAEWSVKRLKFLWLFRQKKFPVAVEKFQFEEKVGSKELCQYRISSGIGQTYFEAEAFWVWCKTSPRA